MRDLIPFHATFRTEGATVSAFLRGACSGAYSSRTHQALRSQIDSGQAARIVYESEPTTFDPLTEIKTGGITAAAVVLRDRRVVLGVHPDRRRNRHGTDLLEMILRHERNPLHFWVGPRNSPGMHFCIAAGLSITQHASNGALCFGLGLDLSETV